jgi:hypothetical protein
MTPDSFARSSTWSRRESRPSTHPERACRNVSLRGARSQHVPRQPARPGCRGVSRAAAIGCMHFVRPTHDSTNRLCHEGVPTSRGRQHVPDVAAFPERDRHRSEIDAIPSGNRKGSLIRLPPGPIHGREKSARVLFSVRGRHLRHETRNVGVLAREDDRRHVLETRSAQDETLGPDLQQS